MPLKKIQLILLWIIAITFFLPLSARAQAGAGSASQDLIEAAKLYNSGDYTVTLDKLSAATEAIWSQAPLSVRNVNFITAQPTNFATYQPRYGESFKSPEPLILYCEPIGFTQNKKGDTYNYSLMGSFNILDDTGKVLGGQQNLGPYAQSNYRTFSTETMLSITIGIQGLPVGSYTLEVTLTDDLNSAKSVKIKKPFNIVE